MYVEAVITAKHQINCRGEGCDAVLDILLVNAYMNGSAVKQEDPQHKQEIIIKLSFQVLQCQPYVQIQQYSCTCYLHPMMRVTLLVELLRQGFPALLLEVYHPAAPRLGQGYR